MVNLSETEFLKLAKEGNLIPVYREILADMETPLSAYQKLGGGLNSFMLESVEGGEHLGRYSFVGVNPRAVITQRGSQVRVVEDSTVESYLVSASASDADPKSVRDGLEVVQRVMSKFKPVVLPDLPRFVGGAVGFLAYEFIHDIEPVVARPAQDDLKLPTLVFLIVDQLLIFDRVNQTIKVLVNAFVDDPANARDAYENAVDETERLVSLLEQPVHHKPIEIPRHGNEVHFESNMTKEKFLENARIANRYIKSGDIIQVVLSQRFKVPVKSSPVQLFRALRSVNPSPYMFLLELDGFALVGSSPEIHVRCEDHHVEIRPIAGTRPRGKTPEHDLELERELLADEKERAEHVMLVDLARNDIGRVCDFNSVQVKDLMTIERYSHVMHIVSQVEGRLQEDKNTYDLMRATFPAGTVSGAPKIRAMQLISQLEGNQRGAYAGAVGYFSFNGNLDSCITIRTIVVKDGTAYAQAGGGNVDDSVPENEYQETVNKAKASMKAIGLAEHFE